jgi:CRP/FNR family transcriptional regulator, anaerobic regulatory protein
MQQFNSVFNKELEKYGILKSYPTDSLIVSENSSIRSIPLVLTGSIKVLRTEEDGREILLYYIKPGESCIMSFLGGMYHETSKIKAVVEEDAEILLIPIDKVNEWIKAYPEWIDYIFKLYHKRFEELLSIVNAVAFQKLDERILDLLKKKADLHQTKELSITHQQLADDLGTTREAVSRLLKQMENNKLIKLLRNKIELL